MVKRGLLLINLGSPEAPTRSAVHTYLNQFLTDKYVIDLPAPLRQLLVRGIISPLRAGKSAEAYRKIWTENGSPLVHFTREFTARVAAKMPDREVRWAMRYGTPSIASQLENWNVDELEVIPLYPQYAESSTRTAVDQVRKARNPSQGPTRFLLDFYDQPEFTGSVSSQIRKTAEGFRPDHVLLSFHGLPEHHMTKLHPGHCLRSGCCDKITSENRLCYRAQCLATARAIRAQIEFPADQISTSFQSRLGRRPWIKPYTDIVISELAARGVKRVLVACPAFVADCLETLEEIQMRLREQFQAEGGEDLRLVPSLNSEPLWVDNFCKMIEKKPLNWQPL